MPSTAIKPSGLFIICRMYQVSNDLILEVNRAKQQTYGAFQCCNWYMNKDRCNYICLSNICDYSGQSESHCQSSTVEGDSRNKGLLALLTPHWVEWSRQLQPVISLSRCQRETVLHICTHAHTDARTRTVFFCCIISNHTIFTKVTPRNPSSHTTMF